MSSAAVLLFTLAASACAQEKPTRAADQLCDISATADEGKSLRGLLGTDQLRTTIFEEYDGLVEGMQESLKTEDLKEPTSTTEACSFTPKTTVGSLMLSVEFSWVPQGNPNAVRPMPGVLSYYNVNGALGEASDIASRLRVECRMGGDFEKPSKRVLLQGRASNTLLIGTKVEQTTTDQQVSFLYLMTRRAADALGCENDPLAKDPVVKPYSSASEAAVAG